MAVKETKKRKARPQTSPVDGKANRKESKRRHKLDKKTKVTDIKGYRKRKRRAGNTRWARLLLFFIACIVGGYYFTLSPFFAIESIEVSGNVKLAASDIINASGIHKGDNIFALSVKRAEQWTKINYMVATCEIEKQLPNAVTISISEREPAALIPASDGFLIIDTEGMVLARRKSMQNPDMPFITGLGDVDAGVLPGTALNADNLSSALAVVKQMDDRARSFITELDVHNAQKIVLYTEDNTEVRIGNSSDFAEKFDTLYSILEAQEKEGLLASISYLDVSLFSSPALFYSK